ncbi:hypothetical protein RLV_3493 [Rhizobium leguminosarum bv. viciae]|nr:hypothetical protein RLV_3493 [Rhizobium leguminosarum bv. viciae]
MARIWGSLNLLVFIKISSIIKPEKILLLKPVNYRGDYRFMLLSDAESLFEQLKEYAEWVENEMTRR